jgi:hypothetical protein
VNFVFTVPITSTLAISRGLNIRVLVDTQDDVAKSAVSSSNFKKFPLLFKIVADFFIQPSPHLKMLLLEKLMIFSDVKKHKGLSATLFVVLDIDTF